MRPFTKILCLYLLLCVTPKDFGQVRVIPGYTGYAWPSEPGGDQDESSCFRAPGGLRNWSDTTRHIHYYFYVRHPGELTISLLLKSTRDGNSLRLKLAGSSFRVAVPGSAGFRKVRAAWVRISRPGFYDLDLSSLHKAVSPIADIQSVLLDGPAARDGQFNSQPRRNAASVHLMYPLGDSIKATGFYTEVTVPEGSDHLYSYFMACGFARGYLGMQVNSDTERRIIFSVWDAGEQTDDRSKVRSENLVRLLAKGDSVITSGFGNEGTGGHSHFIYQWKAGTTYRFYLSASPDSASASTLYTAYFFIPESRKWKLIASFLAPGDGKYLSHLYSFLEDFSGVNGQLYRKAFYGNQWIRTEEGSWKPLTQATFSCDATGRSHDRIDFGGGHFGATFYLWNGGFADTSIPYGTRLSRDSGGPPPELSLRRNADSLVESRQEHAAILQAIATGELDTTGSNQGVYYQVIRPGTGDTVELQDTVTVFYKGWVLHGSVFDSTTVTPATFPLKALIRGWQYGLVKCRKGGRIRLIIPSGLAYSIYAPDPKLPPNSILIFDVDVADVKK